MPVPRSVTVALPAWATAMAEAAAPGQDDDARMAFVIALARENVEREPGGGPFAAAVFREDTGALVSIGVNSVVRLRNSALHAEMVALMLAHEALTVHSFDVPGTPPLTLVSSSEPCAMCLGATLWSRVRRLVCGARWSDAESLGFDEGPVTDQSIAHLERRGVQVIRGVRREEAMAVLQRYQALGRPVY